MSRPHRAEAGSIDVAVDTPEAGREAVRAFVARAVSGWDGSPELLAVTVPAPVSALDVPLRLWPDRGGVLWAPPRGTALAGVGTAVRLEPEGPRRFLELRHLAGPCFGSLARIDWPELEVPSPRFFGGFAFEDGVSGPPWESFGDASFTLPRWSYGLAGRRAFLRLVLRAPADAGPFARERALEELEALWAALERDTTPVYSLPLSSLDSARVDQQPLELWSAQIEAIRETIHRGGFEKIVAARRCEVELPHTIDPLSVHARLSQDFPSCTRFAFRRDGTCFLGATPERLISRYGLEIETEALAGSIQAGREDQAEQLLNSSKDLEEHWLVVREIERHLRPLCARLEVPDRPQIRRLRHVLHLRTPITGALHGPVHVLELVAALHPTPAVGGVPVREAVRWILEHEPAVRGWYASPVGWFDAAGDGEFVVALRSGVVRDQRAWIYAGAGIVRDSDPVSEYLETGLKQRALLGALGVEA